MQLHPPPPFPPKTTLNVSLFPHLRDQAIVHRCAGEWLHSKYNCNFFLLIDETSFEAGIKVQIHTQNEPPFIDQLGFGVAPGFQTFVSCQEQRVSLINTVSMLCIIYSKHHTLPDTSRLDKGVEGSFWQGYLILNNNDGHEHVDKTKLERASGLRPYKSKHVLKRAIILLRKSLTQLCDQIQFRTIVTVVKSYVLKAKICCYSALKFATEGCLTSHYQYVI